MDGSDDVEIRRFLPGDSLAALTALLHRAYAELGAMGFNYTAVDQSEVVTARRIESRECWIAIAGEKIVGTVTLSQNLPGDLPPWRPDLRTAQVNQFAVDPDLRGRGIGRRLMDHAEERARTLGFTSISLDTAEGAGHLVRLYGARGYVAVGTIQWKGKTYRSVILEKRFA